MNDFPVTAAESQLARAEARSARLRRQIREAESALVAAEASERAARVTLERVRAASESDTFTPGTRVRHSTFSDLGGVVVTSDGTGVAVLQDGQTAATYGFSAREWVAA